MLRIREELFRIISLHTGQPLEKIRKDADRDKYMSAQEALEYGIIDKILESRKQIRAEIETPTSEAESTADDGEKQTSGEQ